MSDDVTKPVETSPPRPVHPWTKVMGHQTHQPSGTRGGPRYYCACGWQSFSASHTERDAHLAEAWPVLVPKPGGSSMTGWSDEVAAALRDAESALAAIELADDSHVREGQAFPVVSEESILATDRVRVLRHQLRDVMERAGMDTRFLPNE